MSHFGPFWIFNGKDMIFGIKKLSIRKGDLETNLHIRVSYFFLLLRLKIVSSDFY
jgi:hypothetical protein